MSRLEDKNWLFEQYWTEDRSCEDIANELNTYRHKVRRALIKMGIALKDQSAAQTSALKSGRRKHPTKGTKRPESVRVSISNSVANKWSNLEPEELARRSQLGRLQWEAMSVEERERLMKAATEAVLKAAKEGSKLEKFLRVELTKAGYVIEYHKNDFPNEKLQIDLFLPALSVAVEIDGPSHFLPIWGDEKLQHTIESDQKKTGLLLNMGIVVIRIKYPAKSVSQKIQRDILATLLAQLSEVQTHFPDKANRLIELEV